LTVEAAPIGLAPRQLAWQVLQAVAAGAYADGALERELNRLPLEPGEKPEMKKVRFRTLGCYPLSGAVESEADTLEKIVQEMLVATKSERQGRMIDYDGAASMEEKKKDGYF
jgi:3'-phosphoadenosine 5'-phosphosulfate sulfotransferase (PAPS reductase)/FAD synthetase